MKYPRTYHMPFSPGKGNDDKVHHSISHFFGERVVITEKLDGGNCCLTKDAVFARTQAQHESFDIIKQLHASLRYDIPNELMIFGENMFAKHSIFYDKLPSYFIVFNIFDTNERKWLSWWDVKWRCAMLNLNHVPIIFDGDLLSEKHLKNVISIVNFPSHFSHAIMEGAVMRFAESILEEDFRHKTAKWVRKNHVQTDEHWMNQPIVKNLKGIHN